MYQGTNFGAVDAATVMAVLEWARRTYGGQPWYMDSNYTYDDAGQPYVWIKARSGYPISTPEAKDGVPLKVLVEEAAADVYVVEPSPWYGGGGARWWGGGGGGWPHGGGGGGHHGGGHHGGGHHGLGSTAPSAAPATRTAPHIPVPAAPPLSPVRKPIQVQAERPPTSSMSPVRKPPQIRMEVASAAKAVRLNGFRQVDDVTVQERPVWSRTEVGVAVGLVALLGGFIFGRLTVLEG